MRVVKVTALEGFYRCCLFMDKDGPLIVTASMSGSWDHLPWRIRNATSVYPEDAVAMCGGAMMTFSYRTAEAMCPIDCGLIATSVRNLGSK